MTLTIPQEIETIAAEQARHVGVDTDCLLLKALQDYFLPIPPALQDEFDAWEIASDEDALLVEKKLSELSDEVR